MRRGGGSIFIVIFIFYCSERRVVTFTAKSFISSSESVKIKFALSNIYYVTFIWIYIFSSLSQFYNFFKLSRISFLSEFFLSSFLLIALAYLFINISGTCSSSLPSELLPTFSISYKDLILNSHFSSFLLW